MTTFLQCLSCGDRTPAKEYYSCPGCNGELDLRYDHAHIRKTGAFAQRWREPGPMAERFAALLPLENPEEATSLGEGGAPLVRSRNIGPRLGLRHLYFKLEGANPTGSFKDRQVAIAISKALELGQKRFATVSSGNVGNALAAYAARTGSSADVWISREAAESKRQQIAIYGARLFMLPSPSGASGPGPYFEALKELPAFCAQHGIVPMISARSINPYMVEGAKTIAYEIATTLNRSPDIVFSPVGGGGLLGGLHKGFADLLSLGLCEKAPRLWGGQRQAYFAPVDRMDEPQYQSGYYLPLDGHWAWEAIQRSGGALKIVNDPDIRIAQAELAGQEGIFAEPHGAYALAALLAAAREGRLERDALTVCIVSGLGLKDMEAAQRINKEAGRNPIEVSSLKASTPYFTECSIKTKHRPTSSADAERARSPSSGYSLLDVRPIGFDDVGGAVDVHIDNSGRILAQAAHGALQIDCRGAWLSPGWADLHVHVWYGGSDFSVRADEAGLRRGVTAMADAGSAGEANFHGLREYVLDRQRETVKAFLNIGSIGLVAANRVSELFGRVAIDLPRSRKVIEAHRDVICGVKVRCSGAIVGDWGAEPLRIARELAREFDLPLMVHIGEAPPAIEDILALLEPGDLVTHCFHGKPGASLFETPERIALAHAAAARGVRFDIGHGAASYSFRAAERAIAAGFYPFSISTDLHQRNIGGPVYDLATTISKLHAAGLSFEHCLAAVTSQPRSVLGLPISSLGVGERADFTVFDVEPCDGLMTDSMGATQKISRIFAPRWAALGATLERAARAASALGPREETGGADLNPTILKEG